MSRENTKPIPDATQSQRPQLSMRDHVRAHLNSLQIEIQYCVTITLKQHREMFDINGRKYIQKLDTDEAGRVAERFMIRLNERVLKRRYLIHRESLFFLPVLETGSMSGRLHLHIAIGNVPESIHWFDMKKPIHKALDGLEWKDSEVYIDPCPDEKASVSYLTKTINNNSDMILLNRTPENMLKRSIQV